MPRESRFHRYISAPAWALLGVLTSLIIATGCEPRIKPEELGTPIYDELKLPGADDPPISLDREPPSEK